MLEVVEGDEAQLAWPPAELKAVTAVRFLVLHLVGVVLQLPIDTLVPPECGRDASKGDVVDIQGMRRSAECLTGICKLRPADCVEHHSGLHVLCSQGSAR